MTDQPSTPTSLRHEQAAATRRQLLAAAVAVFESKGYRATTVGAITDRARTAHGTFYLYFRNKEDAFCQVIESVIVEELSAAAIVTADDAPRRALRRGIDGFLDVYARHVGLWRALLEGMLQSERVRQLWLDLRRDLVLQVSRTLAAQQRLGLVRDIDPTMTAHVLASMTEWSAFTHEALDEPPASEGGGDLGAALADLWYHAVYGSVDDGAVERAVGRAPGPPAGTGSVPGAGAGAGSGDDQSPPSA